MTILDTSSSSTQPTMAQSTTSAAPAQNMPGLYVNKSNHHLYNNSVKPASQMNRANIPFMSLYNNTPPPNPRRKCVAFIRKTFTSIRD